MEQFFNKKKTPYVKNFDFWSYFGTKIAVF